MLRLLREQFVALAVAVVMVGLPVQLLLPRFRPLWVLPSSFVALFFGLVVRRLVVGTATSALAGGKCGKARRRYLLLKVSSLSKQARQACSLSLAACDAGAQEYERCLDAVSSLHIPDSEKSLLAVSLNLRAYCLARLGRDLELGLRLAQECVSLRSYVQGFRHTRGLLLLELGRYEEAARDLDATWASGKGSTLFESERCFDLGRLWKLRGQKEYASDYFLRSLRACPDGPWGRRSAKRVGESAPSYSLLDAIL